MNFLFPVLRFNINLFVWSLLIRIGGITSRSVGAWFGMMFRLTTNCSICSLGLATFITQPGRNRYTPWCCSTQLLLVCSISPLLHVGTRGPGRLSYEYFLFGSRQGNTEVEQRGSVNPCSKVTFNSFLIKAWLFQDLCVERLSLRRGLMLRLHCWRWINGKS